MGDGRDTGVSGPVGRRMRVGARNPGRFVTSCGREGTFPGQYVKSGPARRPGFDASARIWVSGAVRVPSRAMAARNPGRFGQSGPIPSRLRRRTHAVRAGSAYPGRIGRSCEADLLFPGQCGLSGPRNRPGSTGTGPLLRFRPCCPRCTASRRGVARFGAARVERKRHRPPSSRPSARASAPAAPPVRLER